MDSEIWSRPVAGKGTNVMVHRLPWTAALQKDCSSVIRYKNTCEPEGP
jgi:hypothetical protein